MLGSFLIAVRTHLMGAIQERNGLYWLRMRTQSILEESHGNRSTRQLESSHLQSGVERDEYRWPGFFLPPPLLPAPPTGTSGQRMGPEHLGWVFQSQSNLETASQTCPEFCLLGDSRYQVIVHIRHYRWVQKWCARIPKRVQELLSHGLSWETCTR